MSVADKQQMMEAMVTRLSSDERFDFMQAFSIDQVRAMCREALDAALTVVPLDCGAMECPRSMTQEAEG